MNKIKVLFVRTTEKQHAEIAKDAKRESRSSSNFLLWIYEQYKKMKK